MQDKPHPHQGTDTAIPRIHPLPNGHEGRDVLIRVMASQGLNTLNKVPVTPICVRGGEAHAGLSATESPKLS